MEPVFDVYLIKCMNNILILYVKKGIWKSELIFVKVCA